MASPLGIGSPIGRVDVRWAADETIRAADFLAGGFKTFQAAEAAARRFSSGKWDPVVLYKTRDGKYAIRRAERENGQEVWKLGGDFRKMRSWDNRFTTCELIDGNKTWRK